MNWVNTNGKSTTGTYWGWGC